MKGRPSSPPTSSASAQVSPDCTTTASADASNRMFEGIGPTLIMAVVRHVIREFKVGLEELHNDSTTVSFYGATTQPARKANNGDDPRKPWGGSEARNPEEG